MMKKAIAIGLMVIGVAFLGSNLYSEEEVKVQPPSESQPQVEEQKGIGWENGAYFKLEKQNGRWIFVDPNGKPFYSVGMVYAYGPEMGAVKPQLTAQQVIAELEKMKQHGYNTLDLYGRFFIEDILDWCDRNEMAVYLRTSYTEIKGLTAERAEFPDFMDQSFRLEAKNYMASVISGLKDYHSVLAIDMDQRWLFGVDWSGEKRLGEPKLGPESIRYLPEWLKGRYVEITRLNQAWGKSYQQFTDVTQDEEIFQNGKVRDLQKRPWRLDFVEYALWTMNDFLKDLVAAMRTVDPNHLITYTTELPEVIPFPISTKENSGIDFISPVHYNGLSDFERDWIANAKIIAQTKFQSDMSGLPSYINETGFRTNPLHQRPPNVDYAMSLSEEQKAELYLHQSSLMNIYPWLTGWSYFKWYDKWPEGDFGYIQNDGSLKPISRLGKIANSRMQVSWQGEGEAKVMVLYPEYALAAPFTGFPQFKSLVLFLENEYLKTHEKMVKDCVTILTGIENLEGLTPALFASAAESFQKLWVPFAFSKNVNDKLPILLAGRQLEMLSEADRQALMKAKTISFGSVGIYDERFIEKSPWYLDAVGLPKEAYAEKMIPQDLKLAGEKEEKAVCKKDKVEFLLPKKTDGKLDSISCEGQKIEIAKGIYSTANFLMASSEGDLTDKVTFQYSDGTEESEYLAKTIGDYHFPPNFNHIGWAGKMDQEAYGYLSHIQVPANASKYLVAIVLPKRPELKVYSLSLVEGGESRNTKVSVVWNDLKTEGRSSWVMSIREGEGKYKVLATFENGRPAVIQSEDGNHIAFLYDPLSWGTESKEISRDIDFHSKLLNDLIKKLQEKS